MTRVRFGFKERTNCHYSWWWREFVDDEGRVYHGSVIFLFSGLYRNLTPPL